MDLKSFVIQSYVLFNDCCDVLELYNHVYFILDIKNLSSSNYLLSSQQPIKFLLHIRFSDRIYFLTNLINEPPFAFDKISPFFILPLSQLSLFRPKYIFQDVKVIGSLTKMHLEYA